MKLPLLIPFALTVSAAFAIAADVIPIVEVESDYLVGAYTSGKWLVSEKAAKLVKPNLEYRVYSLTRELGKAKGGKPTSGADVCPEVFTVELSPKNEKGVIALAAPWNALPRTPQLAATTQPVYLEAAREFLQSRGIKEPKVKITKIVRIDLEGDGEEEVLLSATNYFSKEEGVPSSAPAGSYSFVLLRRVVAGKVRTQLIEGDFYPKAKTFNAPAVYEISAVLDLDGDGKLEVVVHGGYYEGGWTTIYRCTPAKIEELLVVSCGV
jgi:hypothetical protein